MGLTRSSSKPELDIVSNDALLTDAPREISAADLIERAAALGPIRTSWESTYSPEDPVLVEKMQEHVARRRERFQKIVKSTLGACLGVCVLALIITAITNGDDAGGAVATATGRSSPAVTAPSIEKLQIAARAKAQRVVPHPAPVVATTWNARAVKRR